jgi:hypothetical protein
MGISISTTHNLKFNIVSDKRAAQVLLDNAEREDFYLEECHDDRANSLARRTLTYSPNMISLRDNNYAIAYAESATATVPLRLLNDLGKVNIIQLMPSADGGMPHTRPGSIICYPDISQFFSQTTLIHELWHIHQREFKDVWFKAFKRLGWVMWDGKLPENLEKARRYNPDTIDCPFWIFNDVWVPVPIFKDISRPNVADVEIWFYNPVKQYHVTRVPDEVSSYFPNLPPSAYEHPREITAYMLSEPNKYSSSMGFKHLIESIGQISIMKTENVTK